MAAPAVPSPQCLNAFTIVSTSGAPSAIDVRGRMVVLGPFLYVFASCYTPHCLYRLHLGSLHWTELTLGPQPRITETFGTGAHFTLSSTADGGALVCVDHSDIMGDHHVVHSQRRQVRVHVLEVSSEHDLVHWHTLNCTGDVPELHGGDLVSGLSPANTAYTVSDGHRKVHELSVTVRTDQHTATTSYSAHWQLLFAHTDPEEGEQDNHPWTPPDQTPLGQPWKERRIVLFEKSFVLLGGGNESDLIGLEQLYCFDLVLCEWVQPWQTQPDPVKGYPAPRTDHSVMHFEHDLLVCSGEDDIMQHLDLWSLDVRTRKWQQLSTYIPEQECSVYPAQFCLSPEGEIWGVGEDDTSFMPVVVCRAKLRLCSLVECAARALLTARPSLADAPLDHLLLDVRVPRDLVPLVNHHKPVPTTRTAEQLANLQLLLQTRLTQGHYNYYYQTQTRFYMKKPELCLYLAMLIAGIGSALIFYILIFSF